MKCFLNLFFNWENFNLKQTIFTNNSDDRHLQWNTDCTRKFYNQFICFWCEANCGLYSIKELVYNYRTD